MQPLGIYISVPFCKAKCTFCNFASDVFAPARLDRYIDRVCQEIAAARATAAQLGAHLPEAADTLYLGGGTPSLLAPAHIRQLLDALRNEFSIVPNAEFTLECAPGQLSPESLEEFLRHGLNRVSLGVQSFVDRESAAIGRLHTAEICFNEIARLQVAGVRDLSLDLIVGLPHQTRSSWLHSLDTAIASGIPHVSVYMLELDEDSRLGRELLREGKRYSAAAVPSDDDTADWYQLACGRLDSAGIHQYEISNFAHPGHQSRHNLKYWQRHPYIGFGLDAHSMLPAAHSMLRAAHSVLNTPTASVRFANTADLDLYSVDQATPNASVLPIYTPQPELHDNAPLPLPEIDRISTAQAFEESLFLGLRLNAGVDLAALRSEFGAVMLQDIFPSIEELCAAGLLRHNGDTIALTPRGRAISNEVFSRLLLTAV